LEYVGEYGYKANWADSYFSRDLETGSATQQPLFHSYNVDVTTLDPGAATDHVPGYISSLNISSPCDKTESSHGWPIDFYSNTIAGNFSSVYDGSDYNGFGFSLSEEAGNWDFATNQYSPGNGFLGSGSVKILGPEDPPCTPYVLSPVYLGSGISFPTSSTVKSTTGTLQTFFKSFWRKVGRRYG